MHHQLNLTMHLSISWHLDYYQMYCLQYLELAINVMVFL